MNKAQIKFVATVIVISASAAVIVGALAVLCYSAMNCLDAPTVNTIVGGT